MLNLRQSGQVSSELSGNAGCGSLPMPVFATQENGIASTLGGELDTFGVGSNCDDDEPEVICARPTHSSQPEAQHESEPFIHEDLS